MNAPSPRPRLLVFVVAYRAETTLHRVLERIPGEVFDDYDCEILVVDDASEDRTFAIGCEYRARHPQIRTTVLRNDHNQGYGGNQKVGYTYALAEGFDFVALVHGDGQYAPEELPRLMVPLRTGEADVVFGSRMLPPSAALRGGMPLYKYLGNRVLSATQNFLLGSRLSEFHSGYRIYSTWALRKVRFHLNSNDFHFDTEIIVQLMNAKVRILELPIPTYYGDEICHVNGLSYAGNVIVATLKNVFHRAGVLYQRRFDPVDEAPPYDVKLGYASSHQWALDAVPEGSRVIDIGAGPGLLAAELRRKSCQVAVVDRYDAQIADPGVRVIVQDLDEELTFEIGEYEYILMLDIIEHLKDPERFIEELRRQFGHQPKTLILTTPNVAFVVQRLMLLAGQFNYGKAGVLDRTHVRLFTFRSIRQLLRDAGFRIQAVKGVPAPFPKVLGAGALGFGLLWLNSAAIRLSKALFSYQIFIVARTTPDAAFVLCDARSKG